MTTINFALLALGEGPIVSTEYPNPPIDVLHLGLPPLYNHRTDKPTTDMFVLAIDKECECENDDDRLRRMNEVSVWAAEALRSIQEALARYRSMPQMTTVPSGPAISNLPTPEPFGPSVEDVVGDWVVSQRRHRVVTEEEEEVARGIAGGVPAGRSSDRRPSRGKPVRAPLLPPRLVPGGAR
jgi:hypothetical protein